MKNQFFLCSQAWNFFRFSALLIQIFYSRFGDPDSETLITEIFLDHLLGNEQNVDMADPKQYQILILLVFSNSLV